MDFLATPARRRILFGALYMSEGAPIGFLWWALPTILRSRGAPLEDITTLSSLLVLPWAFKILWAPLIDVSRARISLKTWILLAQFLMGLSLFPLLWISPSGEFLAVALFLVIHSFAAATQDVSIDALCIQVTEAQERGILNGWMQTGMLTSRSLLGGGSLIVMESFGFPAVLLLLITVTWCSSILLILSSPPPSVNLSTERGGFSRFTRHLRKTLLKRSTWYGLAFAVLAGAGYEAAGAVAGPFLLDRGFSSEDVGFFFLGPAVACMIAGSLLGGKVADVIHRSRAAGIFLSIMAGSVAVLAVTDLLDSESVWPSMAALSLVYFSIGLFVASTYALFMDHTDPGLGATQFSAFMGGTNLCEAWSAFAIGRLASGWNYGTGLLLMAGISLASLPLLKKLKPPPTAESLTGIQR